MESDRSNIRPTGSGGKKPSMIGREEMTAMLGGGFSEALLRSTTTATTNQKKPSSANSKTQPDVSSMTTQETASYLLKQQQEKNQSSTSASILPGKQRHRQHRTSKVRQYHLLAQEASTAVSETHSSQQNHSRQPDSYPNERDEDEGQLSSSSSSSNVNEWESSKRTRRQTKEQPRPKDLAPPPQQPSTFRPRVERSSSSSSDEDSLGNYRGTGQSHKRRHEQQGGDDSDSDEDSATDRRRQRILQQRRTMKQEQQHEQDQYNSEGPAVTGNKPGHLTEKHPSDLQTEPTGSELPPGPKLGVRDGDKSPASEQIDSSESASDDSSSSSSSNSSSNEDDEDIPVAAKRPVFVPRHLRGLRDTLEKEAKQEEQRAQKESERQVERQQESRAMVQQVVSGKKGTLRTNAPDDVDGPGEVVGTDDEEDYNSKEARDAWEVRELLRLLEDWEMEQERIQMERDLERRRQMTEEEKFQEDVATGRYQQPGQQRKRPLPDDDTQYKSQQQHYGKRFFHRGAFYMDEEEWQDSNDVRRRAGEYAHAATERDRVSTANVPRIMKQSKVGQFGRANQSKWRGLKAEDTTDRSSEMLLLPHQRRHRHGGDGGSGGRR